MPSKEPSRTKVKNGAIAAKTAALPKIPKEVLERMVGKALDQAAEQRGWPRAITVDNGTEFTSRALDEWAYRRGVKLDYTRPGKPTDNGLIESFNGRLRDEFLNVNEFITMLDLREKLRAWQDDYNHHRPHGSLGNLTPSEFAKMRSGQPQQAASL